MATATTTTETSTTTPFTIPTVDISPYLTSPTSPAAEAVISQVRNACLTSGFFQLTGHGIPLHLQKEVFEAARRVFALPVTEKEKLSPVKGSGVFSRGYEVIGGQVLQVGTKGDLKEGYYIAREQTTPQKSFLLGPNIWPSTSVLSEPDFQNPTTAYYEAVHALCLKVMDLIAATLPYGPSVFNKFNTNAAAVIRLLHYPPQTPDPASDKEQLGAGAHTDFGAITLLLQDTAAGLEVLDPTSQTWHLVPPTPNAFVINIGDMLSFWTGGEYRSSLHRVRNLSGEDRYSVPFFFDGNPEAELGVLSRERQAGEKVLTVEEHMRERFESTYLPIYKGGES